MKGKHALIVEDDRALASAIEEALTSTGTKVEVVFNGEDAVASVEKNKPGAILLDMILPGMSGKEVLEKLQPLRDHKDIPVIVLSNVKDHDETTALRRDHDIREYLVKTDWRLEDIVAKIKKAL